MTNREPATLPATKVRQHWQLLLRCVYHRKLPIIITDKGKAQAVLVPLDFAPELQAAGQVATKLFPAQGQPLAAVISYRSYTALLSYSRYTNKRYLKQRSMKQLDPRESDDYGIPGWVGIKQAAERLGIARTAILHRIKRGRLEARRLTDRPHQPWIVKLAAEERAPVSAIHSGTPTDRPSTHDEPG
jgi:prevent-host-death family protein